MIYNITEIVKDWLIDRNVPKVEVCILHVYEFRKAQCMMRWWSASKRLKKPKKLSAKRCVVYEISSGRKKRRRSSRSFMIIQSTGVNIGGSGCCDRHSCDCGDVQWMETEVRRGYACQRSGRKGQTHWKRAFRAKWKVDFGEWRCE